MQCKYKVLGKQKKSRLNNSGDSIGEDSPSGQSASNPKQYNFPIGAFSLGPYPAWSSAEPPPSPSPCAHHALAGGQQPQARAVAAHARAQGDHRRLGTLTALFQLLQALQQGGAPGKGQHGVSSGRFLHQQPPLAVQRIEFTGCGACGIQRSSSSGIEKNVKTRASMALLCAPHGTQCSLF